MTTTNNGGPAFPQPDTYHESGQIEYGAPGMTLRDYFAAKAMPSLLSTATEFPDEHWRVGVAVDAYAMADAMLAAREARG